MIHGGKRKNAGRKPITDKAQQITIYPRASQVRKVGGKEAAQAIAMSALEKAAEKNLKKS